MSATTLPTAYVGSGHLSGTGLWRSIPLLPRNVLLALLHGYRATISHTYGDVCKYYPSCSAYAVGAVQQHGALKGSALAAARIARCHPWAAGGGLYGRAPANASVTSSRGTPPFPSATCASLPRRSATSRIPARS